jgi:hypothetical protein
MNDEFRKDKPGLELDGAYINSWGNIFYDHKKIISELMPIQSLELPKGLYKYLDYNKGEMGEEIQKCPKCDGECEDIMWYHSGSIDYRCKECGHEFNVYI